MSKCSERCDECFIEFYDEWALINEIEFFLSKNTEDYWTVNQEMAEQLFARMMGWE